jgi:hypothetical protein
VTLSPFYLTYETTIEGGLDGLTNWFQFQQKEMKNWFWF